MLQGGNLLSFDPPGFLHLSFSLQALSQSAMCHVLILILFLAYQGPSECLSVTEIPAKYYGAWRKLRLTPEAECTEEGSHPSQADSVQKAHRKVLRGSNRCLGL